MKRRIFGLENEYGLTCVLGGQLRLSPDNVARYLFEKVIPAARNANVFLENGARLYLDTGFHPEYATPECDDVAELVSHDKAGERIVEDLEEAQAFRHGKASAITPAVTFSYVHIPAFALHAAIERIRNMSGPFPQLERTRP